MNTPAKAPESPIFKVLMDCPVCKQWSLEGYLLRAKSLVMRMDPFLAPVYLESAEYAQLNYLTASVTVCHRCLFASPDKKDFLLYDKTRRKTIPSQIPLAALSDLQDHMAQRLSLWESTGEGQNLFNIPRNSASAILSYMLADMRAEQETRNRVSFAWFKRGNYWTRIALLQRQSGLDDSSALEKACRYLEQAFLHTDFPTPPLEHQSCYTLFALHLRLDRPKEARDYLSIMEKAKKEAEQISTPDSLSKMASLKTWIDAARNLWEDREEPDLWQRTRF